MKKLFAIFLFIFVLSFSTAFANHAEGGFDVYYGVINHDNVPFSIINSYNKNDIPNVIYLNSGDLVYVRIGDRIEDEFGDTKDISWVSLEMFDSLESDDFLDPINFGYIDSQYIDRLDDNNYSVIESSLKTKLKVINPDGCNIYEKPDSNSNIIGKIEFDTAFWQKDFYVSFSTYDDLDYEERMQYFWLPYKDGFIRYKDLGKAELDSEYISSSKGLIVKDFLLEDGTIIPKNTIVTTKHYEYLEGINDFNYWGFDKFFYNDKEIKDNDIRFYVFHDCKEYNQIINNHISNLPVYNNHIDKNVIGYLAEEEIQVLFEYRDFLDVDFPLTWLCIQYEEGYGFIDLEDPNLKVSIETLESGDGDVTIFNIKSRTATTIDDDNKISVSPPVFNKDAELIDNQDEIVDVESGNKVNPVITPASPDKQLLIACSCATVIAVVTIIILIIVNKKR